MTVRTVALTLLFLLVGAARAGAHGVSLTALIAQSADGLTVQIVDPYDSPLEGLPVVAVTADGARRATSIAPPWRRGAWPWRTTPPGPAPGWNRRFSMRGY